MFFKLKGRNRLDIRKKFFTKWVMKLWHRLSRELVDATSLKVFKMRLDGAMGRLINMGNPAYGRGLKSIDH